MAASSAGARAPAGNEELPRDALRAEGVSLPHGTPARQAFDVPYAVLADMLLANLARRQEVGLVDQWARSLGLDPASAMVQDLVNLAVELERLYPRGLSSKERQQMAERFAGDDHALQLSARNRRTERFRAAGAGFGRWLEARRAEGYAPEFLIERLLSRFGAAVARVAIEATKSHRSPVSRKSLQPEVRAFEEGLRTVLERVPDRFRMATSSEG